MLELGEDSIEKIIKPCGLYKKKAKAITELSNILVNDYEGRVPNTFDELVSLPLVGRKTASIILCYTYHKKGYFPVDTHVYRIAHRWKISHSINILKVEADLKSFFYYKNFRKIHLQIIYFARKFCRARFHNMKNCPICKNIL